MEQLHKQKTKKNNSKKPKKATTTVHCYAAMKIHNNHKKGRKKKKHVHKDFWKTFKKLRWWWYCTFPSPTVFTEALCNTPPQLFCFVKKFFVNFSIVSFFFVLFSLCCCSVKAFTCSFDADFPFS